MYSSVQYFGKCTLIRNPLFLIGIVHTPDDSGIMNDQNLRKTPFLQFVDSRQIVAAVVLHDNMYGFAVSDQTHGHAAMLDLLQFFDGVVQQNADRPHQRDRIGGDRVNLFFRFEGRVYSQLLRTDQFGRDQAFDLLDLDSAQVLQLEIIAFQMLGGALQLFFAITLQTRKIIFLHERVQ